MIVRLADPDRDATAVAAIYRPSVEDGLASFEEIPPGSVEMGMRMRQTLARTPWLVAENDEGAVVGYAYGGPHHQRPGYRWAVNISVWMWMKVRVGTGSAAEMTSCCASFVARNS